MTSLVAMCTQHFGLRERPFSLVPDPDFMFWTREHAVAYGMLEYGIETCAPITVITGEIGSGKTTLLRHLLNEVSEEFTIGLVSNAQGGRGELLHWILMALGQPADPNASYVQLFHQFQSFLIEEFAQGRRTALVIDEAQNLSVETLEELRMLSNINSGKDELVQLILVGQPQLRDLVSRPELVQFAQRVASDFHLTALSHEETVQYIDHRMEVAGATRKIFTNSAAIAVHEASGGVPRLINQICDYALVYAYLAETDEVKSTTVREVVEDRLRNRSAAAVSVPSTPAQEAEATGPRIATDEAKANFGEIGLVAPLDRNR